MPSRKILLFGGSGFLGSTILKIDKKLIAPPRSNIDLNNTQDIYEYIYKLMPEKIIYCAGISSMDFAQKNKTITNNLNYKIPGLLAKFASKNNISFYYISTDAVFDGYKNKFEFTEIDKTKAKSVYGISKEKGEYTVLTFKKTASLRIINLFGNGNKENFIQRMIDNLSKNKEFPGIIDQINNPIYVTIAAQSILFAVNNNLQGIYNLGALDSKSNYELLIKAANQLNLNSKLIKKISFNEFLSERISYRKKKSVLITDKFHNASNKSILKNIDNSLSYLNLK